MCESPGWGPEKVLKHLPQAGRAGGLPLGTMLATSGLNTGLLSCVFLVTEVRAFFHQTGRSQGHGLVSLVRQGAHSRRKYCLPHQAGSSPSTKLCPLSAEGAPPIFPPRWELPRSKGCGSFIRFNEPLGGRAKSPILTRVIPRARKCPSRQIDMSPSQEFLRANAMSPPQLESSLMVGIRSPSSDRRSLR